MRLFGKYTFETLRDCLQGMFGYDRNTDNYTIQLWQFRFIIKPYTNIDVQVMTGKDTYRSLGKITLSQNDT